MWKHFAADYLDFSKKERSGIIVLLSLIVFFIVIPFFYPFFIRPKQYDHSIFEKEIALLKIKQPDSSSGFAKSYGSDRYYADHKSSDPKASANPGVLFYFDPNTATTAEWKKLGVRDKTIATIEKYVTKGGRFYKPADIAKIWGLQKHEVDRLLPFVQIRSEFTAGKYEKKAFEERKPYEKPVYTPVIIEINDADTTAFIALPGIGSKLAQRIINFRDKLGGFYKIEQVGETFGLPDSTFQKIRAKLKLDKALIKQINVNTATVDEMKVHPYLRYAVANAVVQYRNQHGNFGAVEEIKKIMLITDDIYNKVVPYLKTN